MLTAQQREAARESRKRIAALSAPKNAKDQAATGATTRTTFVLPEHLADKLQGKWDFVEKRANKNRFSETRGPEGPGPAAFDTRTSLSKGTAAPMAGRHKPIRTFGETVPGPGAYSPAVSAPGAAAYSMGGRGELQTGQPADMEGPGPGAYHIASAAESLKDSAPQFGFGLKTAEKDLKCSPGPAAYTPKPPRSRTPRGAAIGSARRGLDPVQKSDDAGVDQIKPDAKWTTPRAPAFTLGGRVKASVPSNMKLGPGPASVNTAKGLGRKRGGGGVPFSTAERMKTLTPETADAKYTGQKTTLSNRGFATTKAKARTDLGDAATAAPGPGTYDPRAERKGSNAPFWGTGKALQKTQALKDLELEDGPGPAMYDTHESWATGTGKGLGSGPRAPLSGRHAYGSYLPPEIAVDAPTEQQVAEAPVGDGKRQALKRMMEAELAKLGV
jgi:hypothetical protein